MSNCPMLFYRDGEYEVEAGDRIDLRRDGYEHRGVVTKVWPRAREVSVRYTDEHDWAKTTGEPKRRSCRCSIEDVDLIARDG